MKGNSDVRLWNDVRINPLSNWTAAKLLLAIALKQPREKILHLGSRDVLSKADIGELVIRKLGGYTGTVARICADEAGKAAKRPKEMWLNSERTERELGMPMPAIEDEIGVIFKHQV